MKSMTEKLRHYLWGFAAFTIVFMFVGRAAGQTWMELVPAGGPPSPRGFHRE